MQTLWIFAAVRPLKIVPAAGGDFNFNALDFSAFDFSSTGSQTLEVEGFLVLS